MRNISLAPELEEFVDAQVRSGRFRDASEVVSAGLRLLEDRNLGQAEHRERLAREINEAFDDLSDDISAEDVFASLEKLYAEDVGKRRP
jgi:antitoxin ParD1/3/4